jgi:hypothetical protein
VRALTGSAEFTDTGPWHQRLGEHGLQAVVLCSALVRLHVGPNRTMATLIMTAKLKM